MLTIARIQPLAAVIVDPASASLTPGSASNRDAANVCVHVHAEAGRFTTMREEDWRALRWLHVPASGRAGGDVLSLRTGTKGVFAHVRPGQVVFPCLGKRREQASDGIQNPERLLAPDTRPLRRPLTEQEQANITHRRGIEVSLSEKDGQFYLHLGLFPAHGEPRSTGVPSDHILISHTHPDRGEQGPARAEPSVADQVALDQLPQTTSKIITVGPNGEVAGVIEFGSDVSAPQQDGPATWLRLEEGGEEGMPAPVTSGRANKAHTPAVGKAHVLEPLALDGRALTVLRIDRQTVALIDALTSHVRAGLPDMSEASFFDEIDACSPDIQDALPELAARLRGVANRTGAKAILLSLPPETVANIGPTPSYHRSAAEQRLMPSDIYRATAISLAGLHAFGNIAFHGGSIHHDIAFDPNAKNSSAKDQEMRLHVDGLYVNRNRGHYPQEGEENLNLSPDFQTLHFQRNEEEVPTILVFPEWGELAEETLEILRQPCLYLNEELPPLSVLYGDDPSDPWVRYVTDEEYIDNARDEAVRQALRELNHHLRQRQVAVPMRAGEILIFDNRRLLHGRAARSRSDLPPPERWRWQRRVHCVTDSARVRQPDLPPRMVDTNAVYVFGRR